MNRVLLSPGESSRGTVLIFFLALVSIGSAVSQITPSLRTRVMMHGRPTEQVRPQSVTTEGDQQ